ncbi:MAG: DNA-processing protein DprA [Deltaproteobacteria bacterium]|nr:DNA-processing protein DprA [Deltaproteobacteria bacterium]
MTREQTSSVEIFLRLSFVEGFTARHLRFLSGAQGGLPFRGEGDREEGPGVTRRAEAALLSREAGERADAVRSACARSGVDIIPWGSAEYPRPLREIPDAPVVLYKSGPAVPGAEAVAIVGSRAPTGPGWEFARELARELAFAGVTVVSGMARGVDAAAHTGAVEAGGKTVAVLGCGVDVVYPPEATRLRGRILEGGALVSEFPPGTRPLPRHFPRRNRIISGLSRGVIVAEAPERSGSLITARLALEQGREVMAVPGNPLFAHTAGSNRLLRDGAAPVTAAEDVLLALGLAGGVPPEAGSREGRILAFLSRERSADEISRALGIPPAELFRCLLEMEMRKLLERTAGGYYKKLTDFSAASEE